MDRGFRETLHDEINVIKVWSIVILSWVVGVLFSLGALFFIISSSSLGGDTWSIFQLLNILHLVWVVPVSVFIFRFGYLYWYEYV